MNLPRRVHAFEVQRSGSNISKMTGRYAMVGGGTRGYPLG